MKFLKWLKDLVLPFENPEHPLYCKDTDEPDELDQLIDECLESGKTLTFYKNEDGTVSYKSKD